MLENVKMYTDQEIIKMVTQETGNNSEESNNEADSTTEQSLSHAGATAAFDLALHYDEQDAAATPGDMFLRRCHNYHINLQIFITLPEKYNRHFLKVKAERLYSNCDKSVELHV